MHSAAITEFDFGSEAIQIQLVVGRAGSLRNREQSAQRFAFRGESAVGEGERDRASAHSAAEFAPSLRINIGSRFRPVHG
jgi:hypothetical protein